MQNCRQNKFSCYYIVRTKTKRARKITSKECINLYSFIPNYTEHCIFPCKQVLININLSYAKHQQPLCYMLTKLNTKAQALYIYGVKEYLKKSQAESFYNVKNLSSFITSKSFSKNLSNENKLWCFWCLQRQKLNQNANFLENIEFVCFHY